MLWVYGMNKHESDTIRKNIIFSRALIERFETLRSEVKMDFSTFVRETLDKALAEREQMKLKREMREGYSANTDLDRKTSYDFRFIDGEDY